MILLCLIGRKETYGYEIITELNNSAASVLGYAREGIFTEVTTHKSVVWGLVWSVAITEICQD